MDPREENFVDDSGEITFNWRAHNADGYPIISVPPDAVKDHPPLYVTVDGLTYKYPVMRAYGDWLYTADKPGPIIPGQPYAMQPPSRHENG